MEIRTRRLVDESLAGSYHSVFRGRGMEFAEVREYVPGDEVRPIDWNQPGSRVQPTLAEDARLVRNAFEATMYSRWAIR